MMLRTTCVISFYYGNSHTHCGKSSAPSFRGCEETRRFYTETLLYRDAFTHRRFYTQTLLHTGAFTQRRFYTHKNFYTQTLLHTDTLTHRPFYTHIVLHTDAFTHKGFYTQKLLHTEAFMQDHIRRRKMSRVLLSRHLCIHLRLRPNDSFVEDAVECRSHRLVR